MLIHLTFTGQYAGMTLCGKERKGDTFVHAVYAPKPMMKLPEMCPTCKAIWEGDDHEVTPYEGVQLELGLG